VTASSPIAGTHRTATLLGAQSLRIGNIVVYPGKPSWVFMNVEGSAYGGRAVCQLRGYNGTTLVSGTFEVDNGSGQYARALHLDIDEVGGAEVTTATGAPVAAAVFDDGPRRHLNGRDPQDLGRKNPGIASKTTTAVATTPTTVFLPSDYWY
jgi:hypothetical protein